MIIGIMAYWIGQVMLGLHFINNINKTAGLAFIVGVSLLCIGYFFGGLVLIRYLIQSVGISMLALGYVLIGARLLKED